MLEVVVLDAVPVVGLVLVVVYTAAVDMGIVHERWDFSEGIWGSEGLYIGHRYEMMDDKSANEMSEDIAVVSVSVVVQVEIGVVAALVVGQYLNLYYNDNGNSVVNVEDE